MYARVQSKCPGCGGQIILNEEIEQTTRGWCHRGCSIPNGPEPYPSETPAGETAERLHGWSHETGNTYLAETADTEGHDLAVRVKVGTRTLPVPECGHKHSTYFDHG